MENELVGRRAQDVQSGLRDVDDAIVASTVPVTTQVGMAALLAIHIRGLDVQENITGLYNFARSLGIAGTALPHVLRLLEAAGWIRVSPSVNNIKSIEESIPSFEPLYRTLGQQWQQMAPSELEEATLTLVESLATAPKPFDLVASETGLAPKDLQRILDIGDLGGFFRSYSSAREGRRIIYSPLFADEHPQAILNYISGSVSRYPEILAVFQQARQTPGLPLASIESAHPIVLEMIDSNVISAPAVDSSSGRHSFLFPQIKYDGEPAIVNKAKVLLSCIRYGERFSTVTRVIDPAYLLGRLRDTQIIGKTPHSNIGTQYTPAANLGIGFVESHGDRYSFHLYDTEDNKAAVTLAIELANGRAEGPAQKLIDESIIAADLRTEQVQGIVLPAANRGSVARARRTLDPRTKTAINMQAELLDDLRGIRRVT